MKAVLRVIAVLALGHYAIAGPYGDDGDARRPRRRRGEEQADDYSDSRSRRATRDPDQERRERAAEMNRMRSRNREEMTSTEYTEEIL